MYQPGELAAFTFSEFERGLEGLTDEEARTRCRKADGTEMNAISWIVRHVSIQWRNVGAYAETPDEDAARTLLPQVLEPDPPSLAEALEAWEAAKAANRWMLENEYAFLDTVREGANSVQEYVGTYLMRTVLHTWFHAGEVNSIRQLLGHPEIRYVAPMDGKLEWQPV
jgi:hypothetical protein